MSAFNAFFAQLTGGGTPSPSNRGGAAAEQQGHDAGTSGGSGGGGSGGGDASGSSSNVRRGSGSGTASDRERGSSSSDAFGIPVNGTSFTYRITESDRGRFGTPQVHYTWCSNFVCVCVRERGGGGYTGCLLLRSLYEGRQWSWTSV